MTINEQSKDRNQFKPASPRAVGKAACKSQIGSRYEQSRWIFKRPELGFFGVMRSEDWHGCCCLVGHFLRILTTGSSGRDGRSGASLPSRSVQSKSETKQEIHHRCNANRRIPPRREIAMTSSVACAPPSSLWFQNSFGAHDGPLAMMPKHHRRRIRGRRGYHCARLLAARVPRP